MKEAYYIRVSTIEQNLQRQIAAVPKGCLTFADKVSGKVPFNQRPRGKALLKAIADGQIDTVHVKSIDLRA